MLMNYIITTKPTLRFIGFQRVFSMKNGQTEIPKFWDEINAKYAHIYQGKQPTDSYEKAVADYGIGEYGVCIDDIGDGTYRYLIAGQYTGGEVPKGMVVYEIPMGEWAIFDCIGPMPAALQSLTNQIFGRWLPDNPRYTLRGHVNVEWYDCQTMDTTTADYHSAIWIPVQAK